MLQASGPFFEWIYKDSWRWCARLEWKSAKVLKIPNSSSSLLKILLYALISQSTATVRQHPKDGTISLIHRKLAFSWHLSAFCELPASLTKYPPKFTLKRAARSQTLFSTTSMRRSVLGIGDSVCNKAALQTIENRGKELLPIEYSSAFCFNQFAERVGAHKWFSLLAHWHTNTPAS